MRLTEQERAKANMLASMIDCSPHEWPREQHEIQLLCHGYLDRVADNHALRARCAELEAERDAAKAEAERLFAEAEEVLTAYGDPEEDETFAQVVEKIAKNGEEGWGRAGELQQQLELARAGEARAVEALKQVARLMKASKWKSDCDHSRASCEDIGCNGAQFAQIEALVTEFDLIDTPAWLAQQRREAAAEELDQWAKRWRDGGSTTEWDFTDRAAALRAGATGGKS